MVGKIEDGKPKRSIVWFRKALRIHDNPALLEANANAESLYPVFILDPWFLKPEKIAANRIKFLLESLEDLDRNLKKNGSGLLCLQGKPEVIIPQLIKELDINFLSFEFDTEPYSKERDTKIRSLAEDLGVTVNSPVAHTLYDPEFLLAKSKGQTPKSYTQFCNLVAKCGSPPKPEPTAEDLIGLPKDILKGKHTGIPSLSDLGYSELPESEMTPFHGGETAGLERLEKHFKNTKWIADYEKPKTSPTEFKNPTTTVLSPYLKFGCVSARYFYIRLQEVYKKHTKHAQPPVSLLGQLYWREFFYLCGYAFPNFSKMKGNPICKQIPWDVSAESKAKLKAWENAQTGYPWIDAAMTQLTQQGWLHHLARHAVACFLTRGDLWVSWEEGRDVFEKHLIDADWSINNANWMWLSCSSFFYQYFRCYSPVAFGRKYDPEGKYIRHFIPALKKFPTKFIYEPWKAPLAVQKQCGCIIGEDYPKPIVLHEIVSKENMSKMKAAYLKNKEMAPPKKKAKI